MLEALKAGPAAEQLTVARAEVAVAQAQLERIQAQLARTEVRAPFDGTVLKLHVGVGSFTNPAAFGLASAASICELADLSAFKVEVRIHERNYARFFKGQKCEVRIDAFPGTTHRGVVDRLSPLVDRDSSTFALWVKLELPKKQPTLPVDASATVRPLTPRRTPKPQGHPGGLLGLCKSTRFAIKESRSLHLGCGSACLPFPVKPMAAPLAFLRFVAKATLNAFGGGVAGEFAVKVLPDVAKEVLKLCGKNQPPEKLCADMEALAELPPDEAAQAARQIAREVAAGQPEAVLLSLESYLTQVPASIRRSQSCLAEQPSFSISLCLRRPEDVLPFLPPRRRASSR